MNEHAHQPLSSLRDRWQAEHFSDHSEQYPPDARHEGPETSELSELRAAPDDTTSAERKHLEDENGRSATSRQSPIHEVAAPVPASDEASHDYLEDTDSRGDDRLAVARHNRSDHPRHVAMSSSGATENNREPLPMKHTTGAPQDELSSSLTELYTISWLVFFSFWGTLARLGVEAITLYPSSPFASRVLWANLGGSFVIGFLTEDRQLFQQEWGSPEASTGHAAHVKVKKTIPLYIGLATGFCGCFTSFSSFMKDAFLALTNALEAPSTTTPYRVDPVVSSRNGGFSFLALLAILIVEPSVSIAALKAGAHFALLMQPVTPTIPFRTARKLVDPLAVVLAFGCWLGAILLTIWPAGNSIHWRTRATTALVFSPLGCLLRYYLSKYLNSRVPAFPLGTFVANIVGTMFLGMAWDLQHARDIGAPPGGSANACAVLSGIMEGFCGCLTTVSTWVLELNTLRRRHAWTYGLGSVVTGVVSLIVIMGSMGWTVGFGEPICS